MALPACRRQAGFIGRLRSGAILGRNCTKRPLQQAENQCETRVHSSWNSHECLLRANKMFLSMPKHARVPRYAGKSHFDSACMRVQLKTGGNSLEKGVYPKNFARYMSGKAILIVHVCVCN
jgi:hypothetical protein